MKKALLIVALVILGLIGITAASFVSMNNKLVTMEEETKSRWSQVENVYQRRADLIPNIVATVKGYATHEADVLEKVAQARASAGQIKVTSPDDIKKFSAAQGDITTALSRLMTVVEKYPELKADRGFLNLQSELEGTENRIKVARNDFNKAVQEFNVSIKTFPNNLFAGIFGFHEKGFFQADAGSEKAPKVDFGTGNK